jgi:hypothetical protein
VIVNPSASTEQLTADYRLMLTIRRCEEAIGRLLNEGLVHGTAHLSIGQEAVPVGFCAELTADDYLTTTYRGHGWALAKGVDLTGFFAEFGRETGVCRGRGGSMHLCDMGGGLIGASGIVGGGLPIAAGSAWAARVRKTGQVAVTSLEQGRLVEFLVVLGVTVSVGDPLFTVEGEKAMLDIEAPVAGRIAELVAAPGSDLAVGAEVLVIDVAHSTLGGTGA